MMTFVHANAVQHVEGSNLRQEEESGSKVLKKAKLDAIDRLLWGTKSKSTIKEQPPEGEHPEPAFSLQQAQARRFLLILLLPLRKGISGSKDSKISSYYSIDTRGR